VPASDPPSIPREDLQGRLAIVTGAGHGIGLAVARELHGLGSTVIALDKDRSRLDEVFSASGFIPVHCDVAGEETMHLVDSLVAQHGPIPLIVNNVGITTPHGFLDLDPTDFDLVFRTNLRGPWFLTRQLVLALIKAGAGGAIVFVSSVHDTFVRMNPHYSATKAAIAMLVKELAYELAPHGIRVNAVSPGWIKTQPDVSPDRERAFADRIPAGRPGQPEDVSRVVVALLSRNLDYVTGANVRVDGGLALHTWLADLPS
jgi:NAD(P)-dependent dehydrogenase (short-subunit alcohol dehydrogenase family)